MVGNLPNTYILQFKVIYILIKHQVYEFCNY